jgi:hypothetical protein
MLRLVENDAATAGGDHTAFNDHLRLKELPSASRKKRPGATSGDAGAI